MVIVIDLILEVRIPSSTFFPTRGCCHLQITNFCFDCRNGVFKSELSYEGYNRANRAHFHEASTVRTNIVEAVCFKYCNVITAGSASDITSAF